VNRRLNCAAALLLLTLVAVPVRGQTPLVVGAVRDERGAPIPGATVTGQSASGSVTVSTDAAGTFAIRGDGITSIRVSCRYCHPALVPVRPGQPVVAIVRRYEALAGDSPSPSDLANLPYAHIESAIALRPFTLLAQTTDPYPGSRLSDRGLSPSGSLLVDNGSPNYDIVAGASPYSAIPAYYEQSATLGDAANAFLYGNQAGGGVAQLDPFTNDTSSQVATVGSDTVVRAQAGSDSDAVAVGSFSNNEESRQRGDFSTNWPLANGQSLSIAGGSEQGRVYQNPSDALAGSFTFGNATFTDPQLLNLSLSTVLDRGNYAITQDEYPISTIWSDSGFSAGIHSTGPVAGFADLATRSSTGSWDAQALPSNLPRIGAMLSQTHADAGLVAHGSFYDLTAGIGAFWIDYSGGSSGVSQPAKAALAVPSLQAVLFPNEKWNLSLQNSGSFTLPTFVAQYQGAGIYPMPVAYQRNALYAGALTYTDDARLRISFEEATQNVTGSASGSVTSAGISAVWQIAPLISLRAWTMHLTDTASSYGLASLNGVTAAPTVGAFWLTYDTGDAVRVDAIYRRDLLDGVPFYHVDGAISGPIANRLRWYAGAEDRMRRTFIDVGLRFSGR
jgi:hypothetical protein